MFEGVCPVVNVPFFEDESIDYKGLENIIERLLKEVSQKSCM